MKFGIFFELSVPRPWDRESERTVYERALEQVRLADELGFDQVWAVEFTFHRADRGRPAVSQFSAEGWNADGVRLAYPVSASFAVVDTGFPRIRYVVNPDRPALVGTRKAA